MDNPLALIGFAILALILLFAAAKVFTIADLLRQILEEMKSQSRARSGS